ncbi:membrane protein [Saccharopolyspora lacisalsi]|uniref:Membrane protein n=1 Tax=Halosaccharopolyspora lacisalsi TaxID=1000566 RepID=A0A839DTP0_9PSEU|nr:inner membrane protein YhjD [Halosaccharopolyspora lacisalsi]MBA8822767.1 membrane protein [Halosaccharopolyspora lacisalsi]
MVDRSQPARTARAPEAQPSKLDLVRRRYPWIDRLVRAAGRYQQQYGDYYAAAITYFSVLALVPLLMIVFAVAGFVLTGDPELLARLQRTIAEAVPSPELSKLLSGVIEEAISQAGAVGVIGLLVALYSGLGWMTNLRDALTAQWIQEPESPPVPKRMGFDLLALLGLGLALVLSFAITALGGGVGQSAFALVGIEGSLLAYVLWWVLAVVLSVGANWLVFLWVLARLPRQPVTVRSAVWGALFAAVGFEVLKQIGVIYLRSISDSPAGAAFGPILGLLVFAYLTSRFVLFVTAWTACARENLELLPPRPPGPVLISPVVHERAGTRARTVSLFGLGALIGWLLRRRR